MDQPIPRYGPRDSLLKREILILGAGLGLVLASMYIAWLFLFRMNAPDAVVKRFIEADLAGRPADQQALVARTWDAKLILDMIQEFRRRSGSSPFQDYRIATTSVNGPDAQVNVTVTLTPPAALLFPSGPQTPQSLIIPFHLVREDNEWKIDPTRTMIGLSGVLVSAGFQQLAPRLGGSIPLPPTPGPPPQSPFPPAAPGTRKP